MGESTYQEEPGRDYRQERDAAYTERNRLVAALAHLFPSHLADHRDEPGVDWDPEWRTVVFIDGPTGQLSWHLHDSDVPLFDGLPRGSNDWDGHSTDEKYARVARIRRTPSAVLPSEPTAPCGMCNGSGSMLGLPDFGRRRYEPCGHCYGTGRTPASTGKAREG